MPSSKRERELARMRAERQTARQVAADAQSRKRRGFLLAGLTALVVVAVAVGATLALTGNNKDTLKTVEAGACAYPASGAAAKPVTGLPPVKDVEKVNPSTATFTTNQGVFALKLNSAKAPCTVNSFTFLAKQKYFDATSCHRLTSGNLSVLQCGDPSASPTGVGGPGYQFADENLTDKSVAGGIYPAGTVAMANSGPGTNGSQFFLVYKDSKLDAKYTPFGTITSGLDVLTKIAAAGSTPEANGNSKPNLPVKIETVVITAAKA